MNRRDNTGHTVTDIVYLVYLLSLVTQWKRPQLPQRWAYWRTGGNFHRLWHTLCISRISPLPGDMVKAASTLSVLEATSTVHRQRNRQPTYHLHHYITTSLEKNVCSFARKIKLWCTEFLRAFGEKTQRLNQCVKGDLCQLVRTVLEGLLLLTSRAPSRPCPTLGCCFAPTHLFRIL